MTQTAPRKLRLYDRMFNWLRPLSAEEIAYLNQERASLEQHERVLKAEADRLELENKSKAAEVALQEEENARERAALNRMVTRARAEFEFRSKINNAWTNVTGVLTLSDSQLSRQIEFSVVSTGDNSLVNININGPRSFIEAQPSYMMWILPWMEGTLGLDDLRAIPADDCFKRILFVGK
jgi:hypothetical protein